MKWSAAVLALGAAAMVAAAPAPAHAQQQQYGQPPNTYTTWATSPQQGIDVTYYISPILSAGRISLIQQAATAWNNAGSGIRLIEVGVQAGSNIQWTSIGGIQPYTFGFAGAPTPGAGTYPNGSPWATLNGPATIGINGAYPEWDGTGAPPPLGIDFQFLALDLFGRAIGLGDAAAGDSSSVMQPLGSISFGVAGPHTLSGSDVAAVQAVFGTPEPSTLALLGVGLAALGASMFFRRSTLGL